MALPATDHSNARKNHNFTLWFVPLTAVAAVPAYYSMFTDFSPWDDEGALMVTVKQYLDGSKLYNQISVPYGPVYYLYNWALRTLSGTSVTHNAVRMSSMLLLLLTAFVSAWIVFRLTRSLVLAGVLHLWAFLTLARFFHNEPGHPQEVCILLLVCLAAAGTIVAIPRWRLWGLCLLGSLLATLPLVKVNIGTFAFLAASLAVLAHCPKNRLSRIAFHVVGGACLLLPVILIRAHLGDPRGRLFAVLVVVSMTAVLLVLLEVPRIFFLSFRGISVAIVSFAFTFITLIVILKMQGVFLTRMLDSLVLNSLGPYVIHASWYVPLPGNFLTRKLYFWIIGGLTLAGYFSCSTTGKLRGANFLPVLKLVVAFSAAVVLVLDALAMFPSPFFALFPPFCWLVLYGRPEWNSESDDFPRTFLCTLTVLQMLYAYPIAGSQFYFVQILPAILVMVCFHDFLAWQRRKLPLFTLSPDIVRTIAPILLLCVAASYIAIARNSRRVYDSLPSLQLPGSGRIHLQKAQAQDYRWLVTQLDDYCDVFVGLPEFPSLHIWTGKDPLNGLAMSDWMIAISNEQQMTASKVLSEHPNACAIYNPELLTFWDRPHHDIDSLPLVRYIHENFKVAGASGHFFFLVRNDRNLGLRLPLYRPGE